LAFGLAVVALALGQQMQSVTSVPAAAQASANSNVDAATESYVAQIPPEAKA
jgi:hypothetical protein